MYILHNIHGLDKSCKNAVKVIKKVTMKVTPVD